MANRGDVISVDKLWDIFDREREKTWDGVDSSIGSPEWEDAAGKIVECYRIQHEGPQWDAKTKWPYSALAILSEADEEEVQP